MHNTEIEDTLIQNEMSRLKTELEMTKDQFKLQNSEIGKMDLLSTEYSKLKIELENTRHELKMFKLKHVESHLLTNELERLKTELEFCHVRSARSSRSRENENCQQLNIQEKNCKASDSDYISSTRYETSMSHAQAEN